MLVYGTEGDSYFTNNAGEKVLVASDDIQSARISTNACIGRGVFSFNVFPQMGNTYALEEDAQIATDISEKCREQFDWAMDVAVPMYINQITGYLAVSTEEEAAIVAELEADYLTTSAELYVKLLTGKLDVDADWDAVMQELKDAGYDKLKAVYQARWDRYAEVLG